MNRYEQQYDEYLLDIPDNHVKTIGICEVCGEEIHDYEETVWGFMIHEECSDDE
ncbi:hypothetical protein [Pseudobutyrivibrio sp.]